MTMVSVVIPTYKRAGHFLQRAIESALNQTWQDIEIIVVDDNVSLSTERVQTEQLLRKWDIDKRIRYIQNEKNVGGAVSRNVGVEHARGTFVAFLDDDDRFLPEKVAKQLAFMIDHQLDASFADLRLHDEQERLVDYRQFQQIAAFDSQTLFKYHLMHHITGTPTFMYRRELLLAIGGFDPVPMGQEFYLMLKTIQAGARIGYFPECHVVAYLHEGEKISAGSGKIAGERDLYAFKKSHFDVFSAAERRFMRSRHHAVMALAFRRNGQRLRSLFELLLAIGSSPFDAFREMARYFKRISINKQ